MAYTADDLAAIDRSIALGLSKVRYADGRELTYRSLTEMERIRSQIAREVAGQTKRQRVTFVAHSSGA